MCQLSNVLRTLLLLPLFVIGSCKLQFQSENFFYITVASTDEVMVFDQASKKVVETIPVGAGPAIIIATPDNQKAYTANWGDNSVTVIDTETRQPKTIQLTGRPYVIAMAPDGAYVYAGLYPNKIAVISTLTDSVDRLIESEVFPASLFVSPDGETLYVATTITRPGQLWAISAETGEYVKPPIAVGLAPGWITMKPDGSKLYALNYYSDDVSVVDTEQWVVEETVYTGENSRGIIGNVSPDQKTLYVTNFGTAELLALDTGSNEIINTLALEGRPVGIHFNEKGKTLYVTDYGPGSLGEDSESDIGSIFLNTGVWTGTDPGYVNLIDARSGKIESRVQVPSGPTSVVGISIHAGKG